MKINEMYKRVRLNELEDQDIGRYDPTKDVLGTAKYKTDSRKPKITLRQINRLKKIRATRQLELLKKEDLLGLMYGIGSGEQEAGPPGF